MMNPRLFPAKTLLAAAMLMTAVAAHADITIFTNKAAFDAAVTAPGVDTFNDLIVMPYPASLTRSAGGYSYTVSSTDGLYGAGVPGDSWLSNNTLTQPMVFSNFSGGVTAFGGNFFGSDVSGLFTPGSSVTLTANDGTTSTFTLNNTTTNSFLGFTSTAALVSVSLQSVGTTNWPTANNLTLAMAAPVPEPGSYAMLLAGVALVGVARRRRT
jgi:hypothetical protein